MKQQISRTRVSTDEIVPGRHSRLHPGCQCGGGSVRTDCGPPFFQSCARGRFRLYAVISRSLAIDLGRPATRPASTSRSRGDISASVSAAAAAAGSRSFGEEAREGAPQRLSRIVSEAKGFSTKSTAPAFIARTANGKSAWPAMTIIGKPSTRAFNRSFSSRPSISGMRMSTIKHPIGKAGVAARKSSAELKVSLLLEEK